MNLLYGRLIDSEDDVEFKKHIPVLSPVNGKVLPLNNYPQKLFTQRMFGEGVALELSGYQVVAPFDCIIEQLYPTSEQLRIKSAQGIRMQIQLGQNPEIMMGNGFKHYAKTGDSIAAGEPILDFNLRKMKDTLNSPLAAITILNSDRLSGIRPHYRQVRSSEDVLMDLYI
ncbi:PTS sugar transporter subunit IIA [Planctobacterium marinum]|uniref:PTS system glucose-specific EIIA component n=1 Tax=Planctobacterium marinum TaxID=1631968 RepID=A0AA48HML1_9ALTE|nr:hypothetical protein MACH26_18130 [Planctobacterium marinum]